MLNQSVYNSGRKLEKLSHTGRNINMNSTQHVKFSGKLHSNDPSINDYHEAAKNAAITSREEIL